MIAYFWRFIQEHGYRDRRTISRSSLPTQSGASPSILSTLQSHSEQAGGFSPSFEEVPQYNSKKKKSLEYLSEPTWKVSGVSLCVAVPAWGLHILPPWVKVFNILAPIGETWKNASFLLHLLLCFPPLQPLPDWSPWGEAAVGWIMQSEYTSFFFGWTLSFFTHGQSSCYSIHCLSLLGHLHCIYFDFNGCEYPQAFSHVAQSLPTHKIVLVLHAFSWRSSTFSFCRIGNSLRWSKLSL